MDGIRMERNKTAMLTIAETAAALPAPSGGFGSSPAASASAFNTESKAGMLSDIETT